MKTNMTTYELHKSIVEAKIRENVTQIPFLPTGLVYFFLELLVRDHSKDDYVST